MRRGKAQTVWFSKKGGYEQPYCAAGAVRPSGSKSAPKGICKDRATGTGKRGGAWRGAKRTKKHKPPNRRGKAEVEPGKFLMGMEEWPQVGRDIKKPARIRGPAEGRFYELFTRPAGTLRNWRIFWDMHRLRPPGSI